MTFLTCEMIVMHGMKDNYLITEIIIITIMMMTMWWIFLVQ